MYRYIVGTPSKIVAWYIWIACNASSATKRCRQTIVAPYMNVEFITMLPYTCGGGSPWTVRPYEYVSRMG
jgi:hypothetical protein